MKESKVVAIIQARMGSARLPSKVLLDLAGEPMLSRVVSRVQQAKRLQEIVVATTTELADEAIAKLCAECGWPCFLGSEEDVLDRYYQAAIQYQADVVVRVTADCPLIEPQVIDLVVGAFLEEKPDYASNVLERTYPRGLDTEVMTMAALERAWHETTEPSQRIHVTPYLYQNPDLFRLLSVTNDYDYSGYRWTVDTLDDLKFMQAVYDRLGHAKDFSWFDVLALLTREPALTEMNRHVRQKLLRED